LGATRDGCKVDIERTIKEIAFDGAYGPTLDSNGIPLVRYETLIGRITLNNLYLKYFNKKTISDCESTDNWADHDWGDIGGTYSANTTIFNSGLQSAKISIASGQTGHGGHNVFDSVKDFTVFDNSEEAVTSDILGFAIYITTANLAVLGTDSIQIRYHYDIFGTQTNYHWLDIEASELTADKWTIFTPAKSDFTLEGSGDWDDIYGMSAIIPDETDDAIEFEIDTFELIQDQSDSSIVPVNGSGFGYTNETTYKEFTPNLEISATDYLENITLVGQKTDGNMFKIIMENVLNDGNIELTFESKDEVVHETQFTGHYKYGAGLTCPIKFREYTS